MLTFKSIARAAAVEIFARSTEPIRSVEDAHSYAGFLCGSPNHPATTEFGNLLGAVCGTPVYETLERAFSVEVRRRIQV